MKTPSWPLTASEAARRLGVSTKALRLYEQHRLVTPGRTPAGYRIYGVDAMARASEVVALRALGLSLADAATRASPCGLTRHSAHQAASLSHPDTGGEPASVRDRACVMLLYGGTSCVSQTLPPMTDP